MNSNEIDLSSCEIAEILLKLPNDSIYDIENKVLEILMDKGYNRNTAYEWWINKCKNIIKAIKKEIDSWRGEGIAPPFFLCDFSGDEIIDINNNIIDMLPKLVGILYIKKKRQ